MIYAAATATMTRPVKTKIAFARDGQGKPQPAETMAPSGLSVFFTPVSLEVMDYTVAVDEMCEAVEDAQIRAMLRALEVASLRYLMAQRCDLSVDALREAGESNVYYKTVRDSWKEAGDRDYGEIYRYQEQFGLTADITGLPDTIDIANVFGYSIKLFTEISVPFALPEQRDGDGGMKLVMTPMADIKDLADTQLTPVTMLVDLYGQGHDISAAIQAAREASAAGNVTYSIEAARITVPDAVFNRRLQMPEVTVKLGDKELVADEDYELVAQEMLKAGTQELKLFGRGDYVGYTTATFTILPAESKVEALEAVALSDLANGDVTVLTVDTPAHPDNVQFDFSGTDESLRKYLKEGADGKTVVLEKGAEAGTYEIRVNVIDGGEDTYAHAAAVVSGRAGEAKGLRPKGQAQIHLAVLQAVDHRHRLRGVLHRLRAVELLHRAGGHPLLWHPLQYLCPVGSGFRVLQRLCGLCRV